MAFAVVMRRWNGDDEDEDEMVMKQRQPSIRQTETEKTRHINCY